MATTVTTAAGNFSIPAYGDTGWAQGTGNLSAYLIAMASITLQTYGGNFTLTADVNFGATKGILSKYFTTVTASPATTGVIRLALADSIKWGPANNALSVSGTALQWNGATVLTGTLPAPVQKREVYIAGTPLNNYTGSLTLINLVGSYLTNGVNLFVWLNGLLCAVTLDYAETSTTSLTFGSAMNTGDRIDIRWTTF